MPLARRCGPETIGEACASSMAFPHRSARSRWSARRRRLRDRPPPCRCGAPSRRTRRSRNGSPRVRRSTRWGRQSRPAICRRRRARLPRLARPSRRWSGNRRGRRRRRCAWPNAGSGRPRAVSSSGGRPRREGETMPRARRRSRRCSAATVRSRRPASAAGLVAAAARTTAGSPAVRTEGRHRGADRNGRPAGRLGSARDLPSNERRGAARLGARRAGPLS